MHYIYNIKTNFFETYYDFYEWEKNDNLTCFKKIPIKKINKKSYQEIFNNKIKINKQLLENLKNKAEIYQNNNKNYIYILLTNGKDVFALKFNKDGITIQRSSIIVDDELDISIIIKNMKTENIEYEILKKIKNILQTRKNIKINNYLKKELNNLSIKNDNNKIKYLYYECFNKIEKNPVIAIKKLLKSKENKEIKEKLYNYLKICKTSHK